MKSVQKVQGLCSRAISSRAIVTMIVLVGIVSTAYIGYCYAPICKIGQNSTTFTYADIQDTYSFSKQVAAISGNKAPNRAGVFQSLIMAGIEKEIMESRKIVIDKDKATAFVFSQSIFPGLLKQEMEKIGNERFYKLFVMPAIADREFASYYIAKDPNRKLADEAMQTAQQGGLTTAAERAGVQVKRIFVPINADTAPFAVEARKSIGKLLPKIVEDAGSYSIMQPVDASDSQIVADAVIITRQPIAAFIDHEMKEMNIPAKDRFYSWYHISDLKKPDAVLAEAKAEQKAKEGAK